MSIPRTKPWEVASGTSAAAASGGNVETATAAPTIPASLGTGVPDLPAPLSDFSNSSPYGAGAQSSRYGMGSSGMGGYGSSLMYGSGMGGMGGYGSSMGGYGSSGYGSLMYGSGMGGMGGYGSSMGGYGMGGMSGMGGYGMGGGMYGQQGMGQNGPLGEGTQATFQLIESIIGAVGGFAQMLEATYMATHSSFFTMVSLAEQFGNLKNALGSLLGIYALINFVKKIFYKVTGKTYNYGLNMKEFAKFETSQLKIEEGLKRQNKKPRISLKPLLLFLAASIGFPYLLSKAIQKLNEQNQRKQMLQHGPPAPQVGLDPSNLQFAKALYEFNPENPTMEIELKAGELVAILSKLDPMGSESKWWKVRLRLGKVGYVPSNFLQVIERKQLVAPEVPVVPTENFLNDFEKFLS